MSISCNAIAYLRLTMMARTYRLQSDKRRGARIWLGCVNPLDDGAVGNDGVLADDDDAILDNVALVLVVRLLHVVLVDDLAVHTDASVLVNDGTADGGARTDADGGAAGERLALMGLLIVVGAHNHGVLDHAALLDVGAEANHGVGDDGLVDEAAITNGRAGHVGVEELGGGKEAGLGVDGGAGGGLVEGELGGLGLVAVEVGVVEGLDGTDILPVTIVQVRLDVHAHVLGRGNDLAAEVVTIGEVLFEKGLHRLGTEDVDTHGRNEGHLLGALGVEAEDSGVNSHRLESIASGLLRKINDAASLIDLHETEGSGALLVHGHGRDSDVSANLAVLADEILVIHAVEVVAGEDDVLIAVGLSEEPKVLAHSVRSTLEPVLVDGALLRGENLDEALAVEGADVAVVRLGQVAVEGSGVELGEAVHLVDVGVDAVGHGDVDEAVVRAKGDRGLSASLGQGVKASARTTAEDDGQHIVHVGGHISLILGGCGGIGLDSDRTGGAHDLRGRGDMESANAYQRSERKVNGGFRGLAHGVDSRSWVPRLSQKSSEMCPYLSLTAVATGSEGLAADGLTGTCDARGYDQSCQRRDIGRGSCTSIGRSRVAVAAPLRLRGRIGFAMRVP